MKIFDLKNVDGFLSIASLFLLFVELQPSLIADNSNLLCSLKMYLYLVKLLSDWVLTLLLLGAFFKILICCLFLLFVFFVLVVLPMADLIFFKLKHRFLNISSSSWQLSQKRRWARVGRSCVNTHYPAFLSLVIGLFWKDCFRILGFLYWFLWQWVVRIWQTFLNCFFSA